LAKTRLSWHPFRSTAPRLLVCACLRERERYRYPTRASPQHIEIIFLQQNHLLQSRVRLGPASPHRSIIIHEALAPSPDDATPASLRAMESIRTTHSSRIQPGRAVSPSSSFSSDTSSTISRKRSHEEFTATDTTKSKPSQQHQHQRRRQRISSERTETPPQQQETMSFLGWARSWLFGWQTFVPCAWLYKLTTTAFRWQD
jgi:hypothetical protein